MNPVRYQTVASFFQHLVFYQYQSQIAPITNALFVFITIIVKQHVLSQVIIDIKKIRAARLDITIHALQESNATILFFHTNQTKQQLKTMQVTLIADYNATIRYQFGIYNIAHLNKKIIAKTNDNCATINVIGKYIASLHNSFYLNTYQQHEYPNAQSTVCIEGVSIKQSSVSHQGFIYIASDATNTNTKQSSKHITISNTVHVHAKPVLDVRNNTVSCAHASAIGTLSKEAIFYLTSRGINKQEATFLVIQSFALFKPTDQYNHALYAYAKQLLQSILLLE